MVVCVCVCLHLASLALSLCKLSQQLARARSSFSFRTPVTCILIKQLALALKVETVLHTHNATHTHAGAGHAGSALKMDFRKCCIMKLIRRREQTRLVLQKFAILLCACHLPPSSYNLPHASRNWQLADLHIRSSHFKSINRDCAQAKRLFAPLNPARIMSQSVTRFVS